MSKKPAMGAALLAAVIAALLIDLLPFLSGQNFSVWPIYLPMAMGVAMSTALTMHGARRLFAGTPGLFRLHEQAPIDCRVGVDFSGWQACPLSCS